MPRKIPARDIVNDLIAGLGRRQLMRKYALSTGEVQRVIAQVSEERRTRAASIVKDVREGLSDSALMEKYQLSPEGLKIAFAALVDGGFIGLFELGARHARERDSVVLNFRHHVRHVPAERISVCERSRPDLQYTLRDISETGLSVCGIEAQLRTTLTMVILGDDGGDIAPFEFDAECRWTVLASSESPTVSGFRITKISAEDLNRLKALIARYSCSDRR